MAGRPSRNNVPRPAAWPARAYSSCSMPVLPLRTLRRPMPLRRCTSCWNSRAMRTPATCSRPYGCTLTGMRNTRVMTMPAPNALAPRARHTLTPAQFESLADVPPENEWFANLTNANTRRAYRKDIKDFMAFAGMRQAAQFREVTRVHVIAWREQLVGQELTNDTIRRKLAALSSLYAYLCDRNAVLHNPVLGVKRPRSMNRAGVTPALGEHQARTLLEAPPADTLKGQRDRAILATLLYHAIRREELCTLKVGDVQQRQGVPYLRIEGKGDKVRYIE